MRICRRDSSGVIQPLPRRGGPVTGVAWVAIGVSAQRVGASLMWEITQDTRWNASSADGEAFFDQSTPAGSSGTDNHRERRLEVDEDRSKVVVLSTYVDTRDSVLRRGELLSAVLLDATMAGLATCTLTHITEVPASPKDCRWVD